MLTAILLSFVGIGMICWLLFKLAVNALPFFAALSMGMFAYNTGAGPIGAMVIAALAGAIAFLAGPLLFATVRSPEFRTLISAAYAVPAGLAGYHAVYGISAIGGTAEPWRVAFGIFGSIIVVLVAWTRMRAYSPVDPRRPVNATGSSLSSGGAAQGQ